MENVKKIKKVHGMAQKIPFKDNYFDMVILNGVLEWVGAQTKTGDPLQIQKNCLKEIKRI